MDFREFLRQHIETNRPIGFSPRRDGKGLLWGCVETVGDTGFSVRTISCTGGIEGVRSVPYRKIGYFDTDPMYAERLIRLASFRPTLPGTVRTVSRRQAVYRTVSEAAGTGEPIRIALRGESNHITVRVLDVRKDWVEIVEYDDLMVERARSMYRKAMIKSVKWRSASEEADAYLLHRSQIEQALATV